MVAFAASRPVSAARARRVRPRRVLLAVPAVALIASLDLHVKAAAVAAGTTGVDVPTSVARTGGAAAIGLVALLAVFVLPSLCVPGALLFLGGAVSNLVSLAVWHGVPDPFELAVAGGAVHFNLADCCVWTGSALFLGGFLWVLWRMPEADFAGLVHGPAASSSRSS
jgi:hypothetical protein